MKAVVLIGGFGTRLRPLTYSVPKQLILVAGKPLLYHALDLLPDDTEEAILATGYMADRIESFVRARPPKVPVRTVREETPLGTGGGLRNAAAAGLSDPFILLNSDLVAELDVGAMARRLAERSGLGVMALHDVDDPSPYGVALVGGSDRILRFVEKPDRASAPSRSINAGVAVYRRSVVDRIPPGREVSLEREIVPYLIPDGLYAYPFEGFWEDAGTPSRLLNAQRLLFDHGRGAAGRRPSGVVGSGPLAVLPGAEVSGASFGGYVTVGEGARVERGAYLEDCVVMDNAVVERHASVTHSILGPKSVVRAGQRADGVVLGEASEL